MYYFAYSHAFALILILCGQVLNPEYVNKVDMKRLVSIGIVDFTGYDDLYLSLKNEIEKDEKSKVCNF